MSQIDDIIYAPIAPICSRKWYEAKANINLGTTGVKVFCTKCTAGGTAKSNDEMAEMAKKWNCDKDPCGLHQWCMDTLGRLP